MTVTDDLALTRDQIKAMRAADSVSFNWDHTGERTGTIELQKEVERADGFGRDTLRVSVPADARVANYGQHDYEIDGVADSTLARAVKGHWFLSSTKYHAEWQTLARFVRAGDTLEQEWVVDNRNGILARARLTMHELKVRVLRPAKNGRVDVHVFMLDARTLNPHSRYGDYVERAS